MFLVAAVTHDQAVILGQRQVADKRGETTVTEQLLTPLDVAGMLLTLDALHTTKKTAPLITGSLNAYYLLILKGNQPLALQAAQGAAVRHRHRVRRQRDHPLRSRARPHRTSHEPRRTV